MPERRWGLRDRVAGTTIKGSEPATSGRNLMRRTTLAVALGASVTLVLATAAQAAVTTGGTDGTDDKVSDHTYLRHDGGTDAAIQECSSDASDPTPVAATADDLDPNDGGGEKQQNEPATAVDPTDPTH